jgi:hypothetical protein
MKNLARWEATPKLNRVFLAADARHARTNPQHDHRWMVRVGQDQEPALVLQSNLGSTNPDDFVSCVPIFQLGNQTILSSDSYIQTPSITQFAPNYVAIESQPLPALDLLAHYWALLGVVGVQYDLQNTGDQTLEFRLDIFATARSHGQNWKPQLTRLATGNVLSLGKIGICEPVIVLKQSDDESVTPSRIGMNIRLPTNEKISIQWVISTHTSHNDSLKNALLCLTMDWKKIFKAIDLGAGALPNIDTGDDATNREIAISIATALQNIQFVANESIQDDSPTLRGKFSLPDNWQHHNPLAWLNKVSLFASIHPIFVQTLIQQLLTINENAIANVAHQRLLPPILATIVKQYHDVVGDDAFVQQHTSRLRATLEAWLAQDADDDGLPEWQDEKQTLMLWAKQVNVPLWSLGIHMPYVETPDLLIYLLAEVQSLMALSGDETLKKHQTRLVQALESLKDGDVYVLRDRDTHQTPSAKILLTEVNGDAEHVVQQALLYPMRLAVSITGGTSLTPDVRVVLIGTDQHGESIAETMSKSAFLWQSRQGVATSQTAFAHLERVQIFGLSRVYKVSVQTVDLSPFRLPVNFSLDNMLMSADDMTVNPLQRFGITIASAGRVLLAPTAYKNKKTLTIKQHGVVVKRTPKTVKIKFPSGYSVDLKEINDNTVVTDPQPKLAPTLIPLVLPPTAPTKTAPSAPKRVKIDVDYTD